MITVLHWVGSPESEFWAELSRLYAQDCWTATADPSRYRFELLYVGPDQGWRFPTDLSAAALAAASPLSVAEGIAHLQTLDIDVALPQMFCRAGMTHYRSLLEILGIPYVGNPPELMALTAHKAQTKAVLREAGIPVPAGQVLRRGDPLELDSLPLIVKPAQADNSLGVSLVGQPAELDQALDQAFAYGDQVLVEAFIPPGREVRCGVLEQNGTLLALPLEEYALSLQQPIRGYGDKLKRSDTHQLSFAAKDNQRSWIVDPTDPITAVVQNWAKRGHLALGCRHYSLFDLRVDPVGQVYVLEAGLYCSFSPKSVIVSMAAAAGIPLSTLLENGIAQARRGL